jgi:hypothetical protein
MKKYGATTKGRSLVTEFQKRRSLEKSVGCSVSCFAYNIGIYTVCEKCGKREPYLKNRQKT